MAAGDELWAGMRVLAIDEDRVCLKILEATLRRCNYNVTPVMDAKTALQRLREAKDPFDLVISELHMPDMDAFKLLRRIAVELGIPVIVLSAYEDTETVMKGLSSGACCYLAKPVSAEKIKNIWKHVSRRKVEARNQNNSDNDDVDHNVEAEQGAKAVRKNSLRNRNDRDDSHENNKENASKKPRLTWTTELHHKFLEAFNRLGDKAVPKRICEMMNVDYITRRNVASHLQKYRIYLQKQSDPSARASLKWNSYSNMSNLESFKHYHGHEIRPAYSTFASSSSHNHLAAQPIQLGSTLEDVLPPLSSAISRKTKASAKTLCGILLRTNQGTASSHLDYSFENMLDDEVLEPVNQLPVQSIEFVNQSSVLMNAPATNVNGALGDASKFPDLFGNCDNSWQTSAPSKFPGLIHKDETSVGPSPANIPKINHLTSFVGASSRQIPMSQSELQNPMAAFIRNTTPMVGLNQQMASFNIVSNTSSVEMPNGNFAPGSTSSTILPNLHTGNSATLTQMVNGLSNNYTLPHIEAESSVMSTQKLNGEDVGSIPVQEGMADQEGLDGQLNDNTEFSLDDIFAMDDLNFSQDNDLLNGDWF